jgi:hypothetical protein
VAPCNPDVAPNRGRATLNWKIATLDTLSLDNSLARRKVLIGAAGAAAKLLEADRMEGWRFDGEG